MLGFNGFGRGGVLCKTLMGGGQEIGVLLC